MGSVNNRPSDSSPKGEVLLGLFQLNMILIKAFSTSDIQMSYLRKKIENL